VRGRENDGVAEDEDGAEEMGKDGLVESEPEVVKGVKSSISGKRT
jgi:hypothetical protein